MSLRTQAIAGAICVASIAVETPLLMLTLPYAYNIFDGAMQRHFSDFLSYKTVETVPCSILQRLTGACPAPVVAADMSDAKVLAVYSFFWFLVQYLLSSITMIVLSGSKAGTSSSSSSSLCSLGSQALQGTPDAKAYTKGRADVESCGSFVQVCMSLLREYLRSSTPEPAYHTLPQGSAQTLQCG